MRAALALCLVFWVASACAATVPPPPPEQLSIVIEEPVSSPAPGVCEQLRNDSRQEVRITVAPAGAPKAGVTLDLLPGQAQPGGVCQSWANLP